MPRICRCSDDDDVLRPDPANLDHRRNLPRPLDIVVGPRVCFQSPHRFMQFDVDVGDEDVRRALEETFQAVMPEEEDDDGDRLDPVEYWTAPVVIPPPTTTTSWPTKKTGTTMTRATMTRATMTRATTPIFWPDVWRRFSIRMQV